jgi:hypothetical protein
MRAFVGIVFVAASFSGLGCAKEATPTPHDVAARFHALVDTLDLNFPGASVAHLEAFLRENEGYEIADSARVEIERLRDAAAGRYHEARELAREGEFDAAETTLKDLALLPDTEDGASAARHLEFEFYFEQAKWLLIRQRFQESEAVARDLLARDLNRFQRDQVEQILDHVGNVDAAMGQSNRAHAEGACRQLIVFLANVYVNEGRYPESLSLSDLDTLDPYTSKSIVRALASIDDYHASQDNYSLVAVSKQGHRFRIVDGEIQD